MMRLDLDGPPDPPVVPQGITIRSFDRRADERRTFEAFSEAFADQRGAPFPSFGEWRHHEIDGEGAIYARGIARVELGVDADDETGATRLYERAGMRFAVGWEVWQKKR